MARWSNGAMSRSTPTTKPSRRGGRWKRRSQGDARGARGPEIGVSHALISDYPSLQRQGLRQQPIRARLSEPFAKHGFGVHHFGEARLVDLHRGDDRGRPRFGLAMAHGVVGILKREADECFEIWRDQIIFAPQRLPWRNPL